MKIIVVFLMFLNFSNLCFAQQKDSSKVSYFGTSSTHSGEANWVIDRAKIDHSDFIGISGSDGTNLTSLRYNNFLSNKLRTDVYGSTRYFLINYDSESFVLVSPKNIDNVMREQWTEFDYINFLSTNFRKKSKMSELEILNWLKNLTSDLGK